MAQPDRALGLRRRASAFTLLILLYILNKLESSEVFSLL
jgi:hypothetical protein